MSPASLRKPIIVSAAVLFTRKLMRGTTSVRGAPESQSVGSSSTLLRRRVAGRGEILPK